MPDACWRKTRSPWGPSFDHRGRPCELVGTVGKVKAAIVLGLLGFILLGIALGWIVRYSRKAARFRAFWNQSAGSVMVPHHRLDSTLSFLPSANPTESYELRQQSPSMRGLPFANPDGYRRPSSTVRSSSSASAESLSLPAPLGGGSGGRGPRYAVPRSTSRPQSMLAVDTPTSGGGLGSRKSSSGSLTGGGGEAAGSSPLASSAGNRSSSSSSSGIGQGSQGYPYPTTTTMRPLLGPHRMSSSALLGLGGHGRSPLAVATATTASLTPAAAVDDDDLGKQRAFLDASAAEDGWENPKTSPLASGAATSYGSGGLNSPPALAGEYHPSSRGPTSRSSSWKHGLKAPGFGLDPSSSPPSAGAPPSHPTLDLVAFHRGGSPLNHLALSPPTHNVPQAESGAGPLAAAGSVPGPVSMSPGGSIRGPNFSRPTSRASHGQGGAEGRRV